MDLLNQVPLDKDSCEKYDKRSVGHYPAKQACMDLSTQATVAKKQGATRKAQATFVLSGTIDLFDENKLKAIVIHLQIISGDLDLTILKVESGSIRIILEGSSECLKMLEDLFKSGELIEVLGIPIEDVQLDVVQRDFEEGKVAIQLEHLEEGQIPVIQTETQDQPYKPMDVAVLVKFLAPCLPFLMTVGNQAVAGASKKLGEDVWTKAKAIWAKLQPKVERKLGVLEAAADVAEAPDDEDSRVALRVQLKKLLEQDELLAQEIARIMQEAPSNSGDKVVQNVTGDNNQTLGSVQDSKVVRDVSGDVTM